jgi:hypothetical protein
VMADALLPALRFAFGACNPSLPCLWQRGRVGDFVQTVAVSLRKG